MDVGLLFYFLASVVILAFVFTYFLYNPFKVPTQARNLSNNCGLAMIGAIFLGFVLIDFVVPHSLLLTPFGIFPFAAGALGLSLYSLEKGKINRFWIYLFVTLVCSAFFPNNVLVFQGIFPLILDRLAMTFIWSLFIHLYATMDKIENITIGQTLALCIPFSFLPIVYGQIFQTIISFYSLLIISALVGFLLYKRFYIYLCLGKSGAAPLGFLMGFFFILMASKGMWVAFLVMPAYYFFEFAYSFLYRFKTRKNPEPIQYTFYINKKIRNHLNQKGILFFVFKRMIFLGLVGILIHDFFIFGCFFLVVIVLETKMRLDSWGQSRPRLRDIFSDIKKATTIFYSSTKNGLNKINREK